MNVTNIYAYTPPGNEYPPFISVNETSGKVIVTIRGPKSVAGEDGEFVSPGNIVAFELDINQVIDLIEGLEEYVHRNAK